MSFSTIAGRAVDSAEVTIPMHGAWWAELHVQDDESGDLAGGQALVVGDLVLVGTIRRGSDFVGAGSYVLDAGAGSWGKVVPARGYRRASNVPLSLVVEDVAREAGETLAPGYVDRDLGQHYAREEGPAARTLSGLVGHAGWHVGIDGVTVIGARAEGAIQAEHTVVDYDPGERVAVVATETPSAFLPGRSLEIDGAELVITTTRITVNKAALRLRLTLAPVVAEDRLAKAIRAIVRETLSRLTYAGVWEYRVVAVQGSAPDVEIDLRPTGASHLPDLARVPQRAALGGATTVPDVGSDVLVAFVNGDPSRPRIVAYDRPEVEADVVFNAGTHEVARVHDTVDVGSVSAVDGNGNPVQFTHLQPNPIEGGPPIPVGPSPTLDLSVGRVTSGAPRVKA